MANKKQSRGVTTRAALLAAGIEVFSRDGFEGASTRAIAQAAGVQQALISFHFRGKEGLYLAVFDELATQLEQRLGPFAEGIEAELAHPPAPARSKKHAQARSLELLLGMVDNVVAVLAREESSQWALLISREQQTPTRAFEILYDGFFKRMTGLIVRLVASVRGDATEADARLSAVSIMGQMLVFRHSRALVLRRLGWTTIGSKELTILQASLREAITAQLSVSAPCQQKQSKHGNKGRHEV